MRKLVLLVAFVPLLFAPPALAEADYDAESLCRPPEVDYRYDTEDLAVHVKLPATGCASRENSMFSVSAGITRTDVFGPQQSIWRAVRCGPFLARDDQNRDGSSEYFHRLDVALETCRSRRATTRSR
jgi:hypothetical protein